MSNALEKLKALARTVAAPLNGRDARIWAETGLPVLRGGSPDPVAEALKADMQPLLARGDFTALAAAFDAAFAEKAFTPRGYRTYRAAHELLMAPIEDAAYDAEAMAEVLPVYERWWLAERGDPAAAAMYATALAMAGLSQCGDGTAETVSDEGLRDLVAFTHQARSVLNHAGARGRAHWLWRKADMFIAFAVCSAGVDETDTLLPAFAAVQTLDPLEFGVYDDRTLQLLPRWFGSFGQLEVFAKAAADRTAAQFGDLLYARIYDCVLMHEDVEDTHLDGSRLMRGFADWMQRFPSQPLANRAAAHAHVLGDMGALDELFRRHIAEIHVETWFDDKQPLQAWREVSRSDRRARG